MSKNKWYSLPRHSFGFKTDLENHTDSAIDKEHSKLKLMKCLAGITWGSAQNLLCTAYIRPLVVEYGNEVLIIASNSTWHKLNIPKQHATTDHRWS